MHLRSTASQTILLAALVFGSVKLFSTVSITTGLLEGTVSGLYEPTWFYWRLASVMLAFYLALASRGLLLSRPTWRIFVVSITGWTLLVLVCLFPMPDLWVVCAMLALPALHLLALAHLLLTDVCAAPSKKKPTSPAGRRSTMHRV
jgi:hypothetical protein